LLVGLKINGKQASLTGFNAIYWLCSRSFFGPPCICGYFYLYLHACHNIISINIIIFNLLYSWVYNFQDTMSKSKNNQIWIIYSSFRCFSAVLLLGNISNQVSYKRTNVEALQWYRETLKAKKDVSHSSPEKSYWFHGQGQRQTLTKTYSVWERSVYWILTFFQQQ